MGRVIYHDFQGSHSWDCSSERPCEACQREIDAELEEIDAEITNAQDEDEQQFS